MEKNKKKFNECEKKFFFTNLGLFVMVKSRWMKLHREPRGSGLSEALCSVIPRMVSVSGAFFGI